MPKYSTSKVMRVMPRLPLQGSLDLTYRCNNCRLCWLRIPPGAPEKWDELSFDGDPRHRGPGAGDGLPRVLQPRNPL